MKLKLFFTDSNYRRLVRENIKFKIIAMPGIKHIISWYYSYKWNKKHKDESQWEQYIKFKEFESSAKEFCFLSALIRLQACMMAENVEEEDFQEAKNDVLNADVIHDSKYAEFKKWVECIDSTEKDYSKVKELIDNLSKTLI